MFEGLYLWVMKDIKSTYLSFILISRRNKTIAGKNVQKFIVNSNMKQNMMDNFPEIVQKTNILLEMRMYNFLLLLVYKTWNTSFLRR